MDFFFGFKGEENWDESINLLKHPWLTVSSFPLVMEVGEVVLLRN